MQDAKRDENTTSASRKITHAHWLCQSEQTRSSYIYFDLLTWSRDTGLLILVAARLSNMLMDNSAVSALSLINLRCTRSGALVFESKTWIKQSWYFCFEWELSAGVNPLSRSQHRNELLVELEDVGSEVIEMLLVCQDHAALHVSC